MSLGKKLRDAIAANIIEIQTESAPARRAGLLPRPSWEALEPEAAAPEPVALEPVALEPVAETPPAAPLSLADLHASAPVKPDGAVDWERIYADAELERAAFSSEQALDVLETLPAEISPRIRRMTVRAAMSTLGVDVDTLASQIVTEAAQKIVVLKAFSETNRRHLQESREAIDVQLRHLEGEIEDLTLRLRRRRREMEEIRQTWIAVEGVGAAAEERAAQFSRLIAFFDDFLEEMKRPADAASFETEAGSEELPPFLREDSVIRLLDRTQERKAA